jgi:ABC-type spermidine/putrescine transport system permease subunit I
MSANGKTFTAVILISSGISAFLLFIVKNSCAVFSKIAYFVLPFTVCPVMSFLEQMFLIKCVPTKVYDAPYRSFSSRFKRFSRTGLKFS